MERLSAPERTREELRALMNGELGTGGWAQRLRSFAALSRKGISRLSMQREEPFHFKFIVWWTGQVLNLSTKLIASRKVRAKSGH